MFGIDLVEGIGSAVLKCRDCRPGCVLYSAATIFYVYACGSIVKPGSNHIIRDWLAQRLRGLLTFRYEGESQ